jgi:hypothetical protein
MVERQEKREPSSRSPRRIAVILGPGSSSSKLLEQLLPLLSHDREVEMQGVFLEEANVRYAAELPFVQELCRVTFSVREFTTDEFDRTLALRMRSARRALQVLADRMGVRHSFRNIRGEAAGLLLETATAADITCFEPVSLFGAGVRQAPSRQHIVAVVSEAHNAADVLRAAAHLAGEKRASVSVLIARPAGGDYSSLRQLALESLRGNSVQLRSVGGDSIEVLAATATQMGATMLVLSASQVMAEPDALRSIRGSLRCPICLVRSWALRKQEDS